MSSAADRRMEIAVGYLLRIGVTVAACVVFAGWVLYLLQTHGVAPDYRHFHGQPILLTEIGPILHGVRSLNSRRIIEFGLLLLIATPIARVVFCVAGFAAERNKLYVLVSGAVLAILLYSLYFRP